jgi:signal transduction histidine kinase
LEEDELRETAETRSAAAGSTAEEIIYPYVSRLIRHVETILDADPSQDEASLFHNLTVNVVHFLDARAASIWLLERRWQRVASFASEGNVSDEWYKDELFEHSIAQEVLEAQRPVMIPNIWKEDRWQSKEPLQGLDVNSTVLVPIVPPRFSIAGRDTGGVLQIWYREKDRAFSDLEIEVARLFSRRVSYALARKKIRDLQKCSAIKDRIVDNVFTSLTEGRDARMRDLFDAVIPDLCEFVAIERSALFSVDRRRREVLLEAGYPENAHGIGKTRSIDESYIQTIIGQKGPFGEFEHEIVSPDYIMITDPQGSRLIPADIKYFLETQSIRSVLYVPLRRDEEVAYFLTFDMQGDRARFSEDEINLLLFAGVELVKGLRLERLYDLLHDSKNIGLSLSYFSRRIQRWLEKQGYPENEKLREAMEVIVEESGRLQDLLISLFEEGNEAVVDVTQIVAKRASFYQEALREMTCGNVSFIQREPTAPLLVRCVPATVERIVDNLLSNATSAVADEGGEICVRTYQQNHWAVAEIANTGLASKEQMERHLRGEEGEGRRRKGRGLHISHQLAERMGGELAIDVKNGSVVISVMLPLVET